MQPEFESKLISTDIQTLINLFDNEFYLPAEPIDADMPLQFSGSKKSGVLMLTYQSLTTE